MFRNFYLLIDCKELKLSSPGEALICFDHQRHQWAVLHHQHQHQTEFLSALPWTHIPYLCTSRSLSSFKSYWQATLNGISWISFSIVFRFCSNLGELAVEAFWDNVDRSMTNGIHQIKGKHAVCLTPKKLIFHAEPKNEDKQNLEGKTISEVLELVDCFYYPPIPAKTFLCYLFNIVHINSERRRIWIKCLC